MRLKDANLLEVLISTTIDIALKAGVMEAKVNLILDSTHTNASINIRHMRLKDANLLEVLISTTIDIALKAGVMEAKVNLILDSTHTNASINISHLEKN